MSDIVTAGMVVIGDEILSGRTKDRNIGHLADMLTLIGIELNEVRIIGDDAAVIGEAVNSLRGRYDYVFTTGGIGPTHDDITADSIAAAFGLPCTYHDEAYRLLEEHYAARKIEFTEARKRMARTPEGATLIANPVSVAPGFIVENVYVMAGVPAIFQAMLDTVTPTLRTGQKLISTTIPCPFGEGTIGGPLTAIQKSHPDTVIGSYPKYEGTTFWTEIVIRSRSQAAMLAAAAAVEEMLDSLR